MERIAKTEEYFAGELKSRAKNGPMWVLEIGPFYIVTGYERRLWTFFRLPGGRLSTRRGWGFWVGTWTIAYFPGNWTWGVRRREWL